MQHIPYDQLGRFQNDWLNAHYHFSFSGYHDPKRMGLGPLRVINDDIVDIGGGFGMHPHADMEIITYVRQGAITHRDSLGNAGRTEAGDVQVMSAGTGITHAEENEESEPTKLYQIWIHPRERGVQPRWEQQRFPKSPGGGLKLLVSGLPEHDGQGALAIHADAAVYGGVLRPGEVWPLTISGKGYLLVSEGSVDIGGQTLQEGDGASWSTPDQAEIRATSQAELVFIDLPDAA